MRGTGKSAAKKPKRSSKPANPQEQSQRFIDTARKLGADESGHAFDRALDSIVRPKKKS